MSDAFTAATEALKGDAMVVIRPGEGIDVRSITEAPGLKVLQGLVGGYIELIWHGRIGTGQPIQIFCNEDGIALGLAENAIGTLYVSLAAGKVLLNPILGTVVALIGEKAIGK